MFSSIQIKIYSFISAIILFFAGLAYGDAPVEVAFDSKIEIKGVETEIEKGMEPIEFTTETVG